MSELIKELAAGLEFATEVLNKDRPAISRVVLTAQPGKVWVRLVCTDLNADGTVSDRSRGWGFMDADGNLWKGASWNAPAKNKPRGTIADLHNPVKVIGWRYGGVQ